MENESEKKPTENPDASKWDFRDVQFAGEKKEEESIPEKVYRGVIVPFEAFEQIDFDGDLVPPMPPKIDEQGRKTVDDGNEYGLYMTDNEQMALDVYGNPEHRRGKIVGSFLTGTRSVVRVEEPSMGVVYAIDTENTDIHKPWITGYLQGHYNNGYQGNEWVSEKVSKEQYEVELVRMSSDFLHDAEDFTNATEEEIKARFLERKHHLETMLAEIGEKLPKELKFLSVPELKKRLREIYGDDGSAYIEEQN